MPKRAAKHQKLLSRVTGIGRRNLAILGVFVFAFVAAGAFLIYRSEAAGCIGTTLRIGSYGYCVSKLQDTLGIMKNMHGGSLIAPSIDGSYGNQTYSAVWDYQRYVLGQANPGGIVISIYSGGQTWSPLCRDLSGAYRYYKYAGLSSWRDRASSDFYGLGCSSLYSL